MIGYIYHIRNKINGKEYIGQTIDIRERLYRHFYDLASGSHHSIKLQRAFNKYGKDSFEISYKKYSINSIEELLIKEQKEIEKYDSCNNGYNMTFGGESNSTAIDFSTSILVYQIGKRYDGVKHKIANYFGCDRSCISAIFNREYLGQESYCQLELEQLIHKIGITDDNLKANYINNYSLNYQLVKFYKYYLY